MEPTERPLLVFISSSIDEFRTERGVCAEAIASLALTRPWRFEQAPASADSVDESYLRKVDECDIFIMLVGRALRTGVKKEWKRAVERRKRRLVFVKADGPGTVKLEEWFGAVDVRFDRFAASSDLRERLLIALADELIKGYRDFRLRWEDVKSITERVGGIQVSFGVRTASTRELGEIRRDFPQLGHLYPEVDTWLKAKMDGISVGRAEALVATYGLRRAGLALVSDKGHGVRKISTLYILPEFQGLGVGPRLLYATISKAVRDKTEKLYITVADEQRRDMEKLLLRYGFQLEGVSPRRYRQGSSEWVWGKRLMSGVLAPEKLHAFVKRCLFSERGLEVQDCFEGGFVCRSTHDLVGRLGSGPLAGTLVATAFRDEESVYERAAKAASARGLPLIFVGLRRVMPQSPQHYCLDAADLETIFFPLVIQREICGMLLPIKEQFASSLVPRMERQQFLPPARVQLRTDNVYYRYPTGYKGLERGSPLFFYETHRSSGASRLIGEARLLEWAVADPVELFSEYGDLGVYILDRMMDAAKARGSAMGQVLALKFDWFREAERELTLEAIRRIIPQYNPITAWRVDFETAKQVRRAAGWNMAELSLQ